MPGMFFLPIDSVVLKRPLCPKAEAIFHVDDGPPPRNPIFENIVLNVFFKTVIKLKTEFRLYGLGEVRIFSVTH